MDTLTTRTNYLNLEHVDKNSEYDLGTMCKDGFDFGPERYLAVREQDECRPDLLSYRAYGTQNYWWFLMWYNGIMDIWNDLARDQILVYPDIEKVREFLKERALKRNDNRNTSTNA